MKHFKVITAIILATMFVFLMGFVSCNDYNDSTNTQTSSNGDNPNDNNTPTPSILNNGILKTDGSLVRDNYGKGNEVILKGVNTGNIFVTENWMSCFDYSSKDYLNISKTFIERFGVEKTKQLWDAYEDNYFCEEDFKQCADIGMTVLRVPFTYMNIDFDSVQGYDKAGKNYDFTRLDKFIETAAKYNMYTILDLHGAYGSHNGQDHSGQVISNYNDVDFYYNETYIQLTVKLWGEIANHYKDNPAVAGYDILNEPGEKATSTTTRHFIVFDRIYNQIRKYDKDHIVIFESCWTGNDLPYPSEYGWTNCMYQFHHYTGATSSASDHIASMTERIENIKSMNFNVPIFMGEFNCYGIEESWEYTLQAFNNAHFHWTSWTYKIVGNSAWGIFDLQLGRISPNQASIEELLDMFSKLKTTNSKKYTFSSGNTLYDLMKKFCVNIDKNKALETGTYGLTDTLTGNMLNFSDVYGTGRKLCLDKNIGTNLVVTTYEDGSSTIQMNGFYVSVYNYQGFKVVGVIPNLSNYDDSCKFYLSKTTEGLQILSLYTGSYLRYDQNLDLILADGGSSNCLLFEYETR